MPPGAKIIVVDDEREIRRLLRAQLFDHGYRATEVDTGEAGHRHALSAQPDLMLLELDLPDIDGVDLIRKIRARSSVPIIVISERRLEADKVAALDAGADDYLTKPFGPKELLARVRAALRRCQRQESMPQGILQQGALRVDLDRRQVWVDDVAIRLTPTEYRLLTTMIHCQGRVITHPQLFAQVWGPARKLDLHLLRVSVSCLRQKLERDPAQPRWILTEPTIGYRFRLGDRLS